MYGLYVEVKRQVKDYLDSRKLFRYIRGMEEVRLQEIEIETVNRCNGTCPFCPVNVNETQRPYAKMPTELFQKIILNLANMEGGGYKGMISLFSNNEPFLDERIMDFHRFAREKLPHAFFNLYTNGSLLDMEKFQTIIGYLDHLVIDNYNDDLEVNTGLQEIYDYLLMNPELKAKVYFELRLQNQVLTSRGGQAPNKKGARCLRQPCLLPYRMMVVRPTGEVSLCCNDALGKYTLGNLNHSTIEEIWNCEKYQEIRAEMRKNGRYNLHLCKNCDTQTRPW